MKSSPGAKSNLPLYILLILSSIFLIIGIVEFRFLKDTLSSYGSSIQQIAINKISFFLNDLKAVTINAAKKVEMESGDVDEILKAAADYDNRITGVYLAAADGTVLHASNGDTDNRFVAQFVNKAAGKKTDAKVIFSGIHQDAASQLAVISAAALLPDNRAVVLNYRLDYYQQELLKEFDNENYKLAVFDDSGSPVVWPFQHESLENFHHTQEKFYSGGKEYRILAAKIEQPKWQVYLFQQDNNFETLRAITIIFLIFALYYCLYQLLVEFWGINTAKTYFDNIDFAIFNQINEGVLLTNNAGVIIFANQAAHQIFAERKQNLRGVKLKELIGHVAEAGVESKSQSITLKTTDKLLAVIHSPIIKKGKKLGALSVIRVSDEQEKIFGHAFNKLVEVVPEGVIYVDKNNEIAAANLMANYYLGNLDYGKNIATVDSQLAEFIRDNLDSRAVNRIALTAHNVICDIAPVHDSDGVYVGTLIMLTDNGTATA